MGYRKIPVEERLGYKKIIEVTAEDEGQRLDKFLVSSCHGLSRTRIQKLIDSDEIRRLAPICLEKLTPSYKVREGDVIEVHVPPPEPLEIEPSPIPISIIYEDKHILIIDKPAGIVVHPGAGKERYTIVHGLLHYCKDLSGIGGKLRPGIVHRLDKNTSGLMVVAKDDQSHSELIRQFKSGEVEKTYLALVIGHMASRAGVVESPIGRHPVKRKKMSTISKSGKAARTDWKVISEFPGASLLEVMIHTGRTHQIRVHMSSLGHPVLGDTLYGGPSRLRLNKKLIKFPRQMLHAAHLNFFHPVTGAKMSWECGIPDDMKSVINDLSD